MVSYVRQYVSTCVVCQRSKPPRHAPYGLLNRPWGSVTLDFIEGLPESGDERYNSILVVVDWLTKYTVFAPCAKTTTAEQTAQLYLDKVFPFFGAPNSILSDRGSQFVSCFWRSFAVLLDGQATLSAAYHLQTDRQTERVNQVLEQYLRIYTGKHQSEWTLHLPLAQFAYNNTLHSTIGVSPLFATLGFHPKLFPSSTVAGVHDPRAAAFVQDRAKLVEACKQGIERAAASAAKYYNSGRKPLSLTVGDQVLLRTRNLTVDAPSKKLTDLLVGPFVISKRVGQRAYQLELPQTWRCHPVFHVSLLKPFRANRALRAYPQTIPDNSDLAARD
ncbi:FOG: Transposon-encoded proteins with TYA, reverse transcriptase, integrase domains in various combinations [Ceraceosorus bombacis]|uniref:FOG: Transposon-encoded proteins with TYA, reverse transcriptase, integrase domains in various combinations n=1 Tax=Ceraceosorus bombacis TaxID=401625 RepID=A0A0P1BFD0_9BASI|nr:FOG: Transposon-encoded proteins with TYA, reverse transcriptase, integrase domains in various combinations [Ceraceosorus bombacis]